MRAVAGKRVFNLIAIVGDGPLLPQVVHKALLVRGQICHDLWIFWGDVTRGRHKLHSETDHL
jgi:hypothetical protein